MQLVRTFFCQYLAVFILNIGTPKISTIIVRNGTVWNYNAVMCPKDADRKKVFLNSVDLDQTATLSVFSGSAQFAQTKPFDYLEILQ